MSEAGTQMGPAATPALVTISGGKASPDPVSIPNGGQVLFTNIDTDDYMLEFWTKGNDKHPAVSIVIPAGDDLLVQANPGANDQNQRCNYNILTLRGGLDNPRAGGSNSIIIGSGLEDEDDN